MISGAPAHPLVSVSCTLGDHTLLIPSPPMVHWKSSLAGDSLPRLLCQTYLISLEDHSKMVQLFLL